MGLCVYYEGKLKLPFLSLTQLPCVYYHCCNGYYSGNLQVVLPFVVITGGIVTACLVAGG